jgi:two-component system cell cycle response regulator DivK
MKTILIADDNPNGREFLRTVLTHAGYSVVEAVNGHDAVAKALECQPHLIVLDIQMPVKDGYEAMALLRGMNGFADIPIIALTAFAMEGDRERAIEAGFTAYLTKPISMREFRDEVEKLIR